MQRERVSLGEAPIHTGERRVSGGFTTFRGEACYRIRNHDRMRPFFMSVVSDSDHWLYLWSNGGLAAGRGSPEHALFPYYTDDKLRDGAHVTGSRTVMLVESATGLKLWEPFSPAADVYSVDRSLYKSVTGNRVFFEEVNNDLGLAFHVGWSTSERFGIVRQAGIRAFRTSHVSLRILDGIQNILPAGIDRGMQDTTSTLLDAYKKCELDADTGLGIFSLSSIPVDRAEPSEALRATTVWSSGLEPVVHLLSSRQVDSFRAGVRPTAEIDVRAERGAYFLCSNLHLNPGDERDWSIVAEVEQDSARVSDIRAALGDRSRLTRDLLQDIDRGSMRLRQIVGRADGLQQTGDRLASTRHFANVLFNVMRGGVFPGGYQIDTSDLRAFVDTRNRQVAARHAEFLSALPRSVEHDDLQRRSREQNCRQLERLCSEYLPLAFSRRHGDPSRPWNHFSIQTRNPDGSPRLYYQGNWRDIFQNWEALSLSFPEFVEGMISTFVSASTPDGYNPYRITRDGIDWEKHDPDDPWSYIGYWGDHQVIYLLKLLEISRAHYPDRLRQLLDEPLFAYANVPYRIAAFDELLQDPFSTIRFDADLDGLIESRVREVGSDGRLVWSSDGEPYLATLAEKLLVTLLAKLANLVPEGGIWMNTQRPEWNDANNALVGRGLSMVTLFYLRRYLTFLIDLLDPDRAAPCRLSKEVADWLRSTAHAFSTHSSLLTGELSAAQRGAILGDLGRAASTYRTTVYEDGFSGHSATIEPVEIRAFCSTALEFVDHSLRAGRREDGLYHAYNLLQVTPEGGIQVDHLYEMLEGQVAALTSGFLSAAESVAVLDALRQSSMYRADQNSYMLYPDRDLARFVDKNLVPPEVVQKSAWLVALVEAGNRDVIVCDASGSYHFNGSFRNADDVENAVNNLSDAGFAVPTEADRAYVLSVFEELFDHRSYTGRSGTFYGYEGLGSIYWHMVSKLLLAVQEAFFRAVTDGADDDVRQRLASHYYDIREGVGVRKSPDAYGACPTDPYSHTPANSGVRQPGMTGQVKEDIISRWGELGITVSDGHIHFSTGMLRRGEFLGDAATFEYFDAEGRLSSIDLPAGSLAFTYCQVPFVLRLSDDARIRIRHTDGTEANVPGLRLPAGESHAILGRAGTIAAVDVFLKLGL